MALTGEELVDEIRANVGRPGSSDVGVITDARVTRWINKGKDKIVERCIGLEAVSFVNTDSIDTTQSLRYAISEISVGDSTTDDKIARIWDVYYLDGNESVYLTWMATDEFDEAYPDPTHSDIPVNKPIHWTRRGGYIEIFPLSACAYCDNDLRFDGDYIPGDFTTNDASASDISNADDGLIAYGTWKAWGAIGGKDATLEEIKWKKIWMDWLRDYDDRNNDLHEWDGKMYGRDLD